MARVPLAERPASLKMLGAAFVALMLFFLWLTFAFFNKTFVDYDKVTLVGPKAGLNLPENADIKLRGMIVGEVRGIESTNGTIKVTLGMDPDVIDQVPADVTAEIIPKTLFGEKYISLIAPENPTGQKLKAGDTIQGADVPIEVEKLLNDLYPLLNAVDPANLSTTLSSVAGALEGRGEEFGSTLVTLNSYLKRLNPETPALVDDLVKFGEVSDAYADQMPTIGRFLRNTVITGNTIVTKRRDLAAFFDESTRLANTLTKFTDAAGDDIIALAAQNVAPLGVAAQYSPTYPCFFKALARTVPLADSVLRNRTVHIDLETLATQPTGYEPSGTVDDPQGGPQGERAVLPSREVIDNTPATKLHTTERAAGEGPATLGDVCEDLNKYIDGPEPYGSNPPFLQTTKPLPTFPESVYKLVGLTSSHNGKFGDDAAYDRAPVASLQAYDSAEQREGLKRIAAVMAGTSTSEVPDAASVILSPVIRGAEVTAR